MSRSSTPAFQFRRPNLSSITTSTSTAASSSTAAAQGSSRNAVPTLARSTISLEEWESRAPLSEEEIMSVKIIGDKLKEKPLPEKFRNQPEAGPSRPATPQQLRRVVRLRADSPSRAASPLSRARTPAASQPGTPVPGSSSQLGLALPALISTPQEFQDHFAALTLSTEHEQDSLYRDQLAEISGLRGKCGEMLDVLIGAKGGVGEMLAALEYVEERSESLRGACEDLLEEQTHLLTHTSQLAHRLTFFTFLDTAQRTLNNPSPTLVLSEDFLPMLKRLDECIGYLSEHRDFKDAELYLIRYQQCMTRSMTLIKIYFVNTVRAIGQEVNKRLYDKSLSETATQALLYPKFSSLSASLRPLIQELELRASRSNDELASLLGECHSTWFTTRQGIMAPRVGEEIGRLDPAKAELVELTQSGCGYLKQTCLDEFNLFKSFFLSGESQLYAYLESLCDALYDHLRPRILHEPALEILCGVCTVLQALMVQDVDAHAGAVDDEETVSGTAIYTPYTPSPLTPGESGEGYDYFSTMPSPTASTSASAWQGLGGGYRRTSGGRSVRRQTSYSSIGGNTPTQRGSGFVIPRRPTQPAIATAKRRRPLTRLYMETLLRMILQDAQTRLVFRAQAMLLAEVEYYAPREGDLDYPDKLDKGTGAGGGASGGSAGGQSLVPRSRESAISLDEDNDEPAFLSLPPKADQEAWYPTLRVTLWVLSCLWSYVDQSVFEDLAQEAIMTCRRSLSSASDLLCAKQDKSTDGRLFLVRHLLILKEMTAGLDLGRRVGRKEWGGITDFLRSLLENAGAMLGYGKGSIRTHEPISDAKSDIDRELKRACEDLISTCSRSATLPLRQFLDQATSYLHARSPVSSNPSPGQSTSAATATGASADLASQVFATPDKVRQVHDAFKRTVSPEVERWKGLLRRYLMDEDTVGVLVPPAQNAIVDVYRQFHDLVRAEYDFSTAAGLMTPSAVGTLLAASTDGAV